MAGNKEGARKAAETNKKKYGKDFYAKIGRKSWQNPERSKLTGFALLEEDERKALGSKGGKKTKKDYKTTESTEADKDSTGVSE